MLLPSFPLSHTAFSHFPFLSLCLFISCIAILCIKAPSVNNLLSNTPMIPSSPVSFRQIISDVAQTKRNFQAFYLYHSINSTCIFFSPHTKVIYVTVYQYFPPLTSITLYVNIWVSTNKRRYFNGISLFPSTFRSTCVDQLDTPSLHSPVHPQPASRSSSTRHSHPLRRLVFHLLSGHTCTLT